MAARRDPAVAGALPCYHPSKIDVERRGLAVRRADTVTVPCGSCLGCRTDQARDWAVRLVHESEYPRRQPCGLSRASWFATLTYAPENVPEFGSLDPEHSWGFVARLRKHFPPRTLSYYLCGEYGERSDRPHYHAVFFGPQFKARELLTERNGAPVWIADAVQEAWDLGITEITPVTPAACLYVAGYVRKKVRWKDDPGYYERVDPETGELVELRQEFSRMSRRPAIGRRWIERYWRDVYPRDFTLLEGRPMKPPRYYDKYMDLDDDKGGSSERRQMMDEVRMQRWEDAELIGDEKLIMKEKVHRARVGLFNPRGKV